MFLKWIYSIFIFILSGQLCFGQSKYLNQVKYWEYRKNFRKNFVHIGSKPGQSIPFAFLNEELEMAFSAKDLGWYIATLATEYHISSRSAYLPISEHEPNAPVQVLLELYKAQKAIDRLDFFADRFYGCSTSELNGLIVQTDSVQNRGVEEEIVKRAGIHANADDYINLIFGLYICQHYVPERTMVKGKDLRLMAKEQCLRLIDYLDRNNWKIRVPCSKKKVFVYGDYDLKPFAASLNRIKRNLKGQKEKVSVSGFLENLKYTFNGKLKNATNEKWAMLMSMQKSKKAQKRTLRFADKQYWSIYAMCQALFFAKEPSEQMDSLITESEKRINDVPLNGIYSSSDLVQKHGWSTANFFRNSKEVRLAMKNSTEKIQFNGLDFLLFYNIWFIHRTGI